MTERTTCGACANDGVDVFLDLGKTPLANKYPVSPLTEETWYPLRLGRCTHCNLVQMMEIIPDDEIYGDDYGFYSGGSPAQLAYHKAGAELLLSRHEQQMRDRLTVEIACNDGSLIAQFPQDYQTLGVDPAAPADVALAAGLDVIKQPFTRQLAAAIRDGNGPAGLVIMYNALAHVGDLADVLLGIRELLDLDGIAVIEVQYLPDLIMGNMIGQVYHEHRFFYTLSSFTRAAAIQGLKVIDAELIELQGGGMRVTLSRNHGIERSAQADTIIMSERWLQSAAAYDSMQGRFERLKTHLLQLIHNEHIMDRRVVGYAAAAKACTILNYCDLDVNVIPFVIDTTPHKWGKNVPGVKIPIISPQDAKLYRGDTRLLLTANYLAHLLRNDREFLADGGKWMVAEPLPMIV